MDPDTMLVEGLRRREGDAVEQLMERYGARTYRLVRAITRSHADAQEVVQDVFLSVYRHVGGFETRARLGTWLYRIAVNAALNKNRRRHPTAQVSRQQWQLAFHGYRDQSGFSADWAGRPDVEFARGEVRLAVHRALQELPPDYRAVVLLREVEGLSNEGAAKALGENVAAVKSRLHRARMALRKQLSRALASAT